jgi:tetratricopeptide (TPR) repeat protein
MKTYLILGAVLIQCLAVAQTSVEQPACAELNQLALARAAANELDQAEAAVSAAVSRGGSVCAGVVLGNFATIMAAHARIRESEAFAVRSVELLRKNVHADDPMLLPALHALAISMLDRGKFRKAEQAFEQMLQVRAELPEQRAQVHIVGGALREVQGRLKEAEAEYLRAYEDWKQFVKPADVDEAAVLNYLGRLYMNQARFKEAGVALHAFVE